MRRKSSPLKKAGPTRLLNRDGSFNISRDGVPKMWFSDFYHRSLKTPWTVLIGYIFLFYIGVNALFGTLYWFIGPGALSDLSNLGLNHWLDCFFFSVQTFATIGYGRITPVGLPSNILVTIEAFAGLLSHALATGLLFSRFSRPTAKVVFSESAVISVIDGEPSFMFRVANRRLNQIVDAQVSVILARTEKTKEGEIYRNLYDLKLERSRSPLFALSWSIIHPIDKESPLYGITEKILKESDSEIFVSLTGIDDTYSQAIHARYSYTSEEVKWNKTFKDILTRGSNEITIDLGGIHDLRD
jgi:inward rectifier potassium channel